MLDVQLHQVGSGNISCRRDKVGHLSQSVGDDIDSVETTRFGEFAYEIQLNPLPRSIRSAMESVIPLISDRD